VEQIPSYSDSVTVDNNRDDVVRVALCIRESFKLHVAVQGVRFLSEPDGVFAIFRLRILDDEQSNVASLQLLTVVKWLE
jgi:hypothetical protein